MYIYESLRIKTKLSNIWYRRTWLWGQALKRTPKTMFHLFGFIFFVWFTLLRYLFILNDSYRYLFIYLFVYEWRYIVNKVIVVYIIKISYKLRLRIQLLHFLSFYILMTWCWKSFGPNYYLYTIISIYKCVCVHAIELEFLVWYFSLFF